MCAFEYEETCVKLSIAALNQSVAPGEAVVFGKCLETQILELCPGLIRNWGYGPINLYFNKPSG